MHKRESRFYYCRFHDAITPVTNFIDLKGHVYFDANGNGIQENNEADASNRFVYINNITNVDLSVNTNLSGDWSYQACMKGSQRQLILKTLIFKIHGYSRN